MKLLIANPNMTRAMTDRMVTNAETLCRPGTTIIGATARFGVPVISARSDLAIGGHALMDLLAREAKDVDAVVIGAFCPGLAAAAKELLPVPVIGLVEAGMRSALMHGRRIGLLTIGTRDRDMTTETLRELGMERDLAAVHLLDLSGLDVLNRPDAASAATLAAGQRAVTEDNADVLVLGGAAFTGMAAQIAPLLPVPVIEPLPYAVALAELAVLTGWRKPTAGTYAGPDAKPSDGLDPALAAMFR